MVHLTDQRAPTGAALCGAAPAGRKASLPRKNGSIACNVCLRLYRERRHSHKERRTAPVVGRLLQRLRTRYVIQYHADAGWQSIGRTWMTRRGAKRAADRVLRNAAYCRAARVVPVPPLARGRDE